MKKRGLWLLALCLLLLCVLFTACSDPTEGIENNGGNDAPNDSTQEEKPSHLHSYNADNICEYCGIEYQDDGLQFLICSEGYTVIRYVGASPMVNIPEKYLGRSVVRIETGAFSYRTGVTSVWIPDSVTTIEESAFMGCVGLLDITFSENLISIGEKAFAGCTSLTTVIFKNTQGWKATFPKTDNVQSLSSEDLTNYEKAALYLKSTDYYCLYGWSRA